MKRILVVLVLLIGVGGWYFYDKWTKSPEYSILQIQASISEHDIVLFQKYVDVDSVIGKAMDVLLHQIGGESGNEDDEMGVLTSALADGVVAMFKPQLVAYAKEQLLNKVEGVDDSNHTLDKDKKTEKNLKPAVKDLERLFSGSNGSLKQLYMRKDGAVFYLGVEQFDEELQTPITIEFRFRNMGNYWQVVEVSNLQEIMEIQRQVQITKLEKREVELSKLQEMLENRRQVQIAELEKVNAPVQEKLNASLTLVKDDYVKCEEEGVKTVVFFLTLQNTTETSISLASFTLILYKDFLGHEFGTTPLITIPDLAPGKSTWVWKVPWDSLGWNGLWDNIMKNSTPNPGNPYEAGDRYGLLLTPPYSNCDEELRMDAKLDGMKLKKIQFSNGEVLELQSTL